MTSIAFLLLITGRLSNELKSRSIDITRGRWHALLQLVADKSSLYQDQTFYIDRDDSFKGLWHTDEMMLFFGKSPQTGRVLPSVQLRPWHYTNVSQGTLHFQSLWVLTRTDNHACICTAKYWRWMVKGSHFRALGSLQSISTKRSVAIGQWPPKPPELQLTTKSPTHELQDIMDLQQSPTILHSNLRPLPGGEYGPSYLLH